MNRRTQGQIAELIEDSIAASGLRSATPPFLWLLRTYGPLFERDVPMNQISRREFRFVAMLYLGLFPVILVAVLLAAPFEIFRALRRRGHNQRARGLLLPPPGAPRTYAAPPQHVVVNYRIEDDGRAMFLGVAHVTLTGDDKQLVAFTNHQRAPSDGVTGEAVRGALAATGTTAEVHHWQWNRNDPYEVIERPGIPW